MTCCQKKAVFVPRTFSLNSWFFPELQGFSMNSWEFAQDRGDFPAILGISPLNSVFFRGEIPALLSSKGFNDKMHSPFLCSRCDGHGEHSCSDPPLCLDEVLDSLRQQESCRIKRLISAVRHVARRWGLRAAATVRAAADLGSDGESSDKMGGGP